MAGDSDGNWEDRVGAIASNLLSLEVNTILKNGMSGQKMPEVPSALHEIASRYSSYVKDRGVPVTYTILAAACGRLGDPANSLAFYNYLRQWAETGAAPAWPAAAPAAPAADGPAVALTNGAETFEALIWSAIAARELTVRTEGIDAAPERRLSNQRQAAILTRIERNSRQLREVAIVLEKAFSSMDDQASAAQKVRMGGLQGTTQPYLARLDALRRDPLLNLEVQESRLFGGTQDQTAQALFRHPRPIINIEPDLTVLIRKAWDIGLEEVLFQTSIQIDGDVLVRVAEMPESDRAFLADLHRNAVQDGLGQWRMLFQVIGDLVKGLGSLLFGGVAEKT